MIRPMTQHNYSAMQCQVYSGSSQPARCDGRGQQLAACTYLLFVVAGNGLCTTGNKGTVVLLACMTKVNDMHQFTTLQPDVFSNLLPY